MGNYLVCQSPCPLYYVIVYQRWCSDCSIVWTHLLNTLLHAYLVSRLIKCFFNYFFIHQKFQKLKPLFFSGFIPPPVLNKFDRLLSYSFDMKKIYFTQKYGEDIFANFSSFFLFFPPSSFVSYRTYISGCRGGEGQIGIFEWSSTVLHNDSPLLLDIENPFSSILLDSIESFRPRTILSPVVPGSFLVP